MGREATTTRGRGRTRSAAREARHAAARIRTADLVINSHALHQLSYRGRVVRLQGPSCI